MKAMVLRKIAPIETAPLVYSDVPDPEPGTGEVRVRVRCCGICRTDLHVIEGELPREAAEIPIRPHTTTYPLKEANRALQDLKADRISGSGVLLVVTVHREKDRPLARKGPMPVVIPAKAGIQEDTAGFRSGTLDSRLRGNDGERLAVNGYCSSTDRTAAPD